MNVLNQAEGQNWKMYHGDSCEVLKGIPSDSIHFQVMSSPFSSLFTYTNSTRDLGNCRNDGEFYNHYKFIVSEQFRTMMPGRLCAIHVMQLPSSKTRDGVIGLKDFRGDCIRLFQELGWIYHSEVCIWKNPVTAMQRTKALGLLHKQIKKDSCMSRQGVADYLLVFRKPGDNPERVTHTADDFPVHVWQRYASPVWATAHVEDDEGFMNIVDVHHDDGDEGGIDQGNTLQGRSAREHTDDKHLCVLQQGVINRALKLWSNPGDTVLSPFGGIGSEGYAALKMGRRYIGIELKQSYYNQAVLNLKAAEAQQTAILI